MTGLKKRGQVNLGNHAELIATLGFGAAVAHGPLHHRVGRHPTQSGAECVPQFVDRKMGLCQLS